MPNLSTMGPPGFSPGGLKIAAPSAKTSYTGLTSSAWSNITTKLAECPLGKSLKRLSHKSMRWLPILIRISNGKHSRIIFVTGK